MAVSFPCCDAADVNTRHARICPTAGAQVNQHRPLLHAISRTLKRLEIRHQAEDGEPFTAYQNLRMDLVVRRGGLRDAPNRKYRDKFILLDVAHADLQAQVHLRGGSADHDGSATSTSQAPAIRSSGACVLRRPESQNYHLRSKALSVLGLRAACVVGGRDGGSTARKGVVKERPLQIVSVNPQIIVSRRVSRFKLQLFQERHQGKQERAGGGRG